MPSFTRRAGPSNPAPPPGTVNSPSHTHPLLPTGIPSLDDLLGGGLPLGGILLVLSPDQHSAWTRLLTRYFISQGLVSGQSGTIVGEDDGIRDLVQGCMWTEDRGEGGSESEGEGGDHGEGRGGGKIAWRYEGMAKFKTSTGRSSGLNLMKTIPTGILADLEQDGQLSYLPLESHRSMRQTTSKVVTSLHTELERVRDAGKNRATRIAVHDLGGADWGESTAQDIHRSLHSLKHLIRDRPAGAIVSLPYHLVRSAPAGWSGTTEGWIKSLAWAVDGCVELRGFADNPALAPHFAPLHGLLTLHSFPTSHTLLPPTLRHSTLLGVSQSATNERGGGGAGENNLGFRVKRKGLVIETAHLGIEGGSSERRTAPVEDVGGVLSEGPSALTEERKVEVEGVDVVGKVSNAGAVDEEVSAGGAVAGKAKKDRPRVRFGGEDEVVEVQIGGGTGGASNIEHSHNHNHTATSSRPQVRHDRPDLYEF